MAVSNIDETNFVLTTDQNKVIVRDFGLADKTLADPTNAVALCAGEWVRWNSSDKLVRATAISTLADPATNLAFPLYAARGRSDVQSLADKKMPLIFLGSYEADTNIFDATAGTAISTVFQPVRVMTVAIGGRNYSGLVGGAINDNNLIVGYVSRLPANNGSKLRFFNLGAVRNGAT
jgi:hypothetical protein